MHKLITHLGKGFWIGLFLFACLAVVQNSAVAAPWETVLHEDGVRIEQGSAPGSTLTVTRATATLDASLDEVIHVLTDVENACAWAPCETSRVVRIVDSRDAIVYGRTDMAWPFSDRDFLLRISLSEASNGGVRLDVRSVQEPSVPENQGVVRIKRMRSLYKVTPVGEDRVRVDFRTEVRVGGAMPEWFASETAAEDAIKSMKGLKRQIKKRREECPNPGTEPVQILGFDERSEEVSCG